MILYSKWTSTTYPPDKNDCCELKRYACFNLLIASDLKKTMKRRLSVKNSARNIQVVRLRVRNLLYGPAQSVKLIF